MPELAGPRGYGLKNIGYFVFFALGLDGAIPWLVSLNVTVFMQIFCKYDIQRLC